MSRTDYRMVIERLAPEDGGGFVATAPELPGCMSDGETRDEAMANLDDAIGAWIAEARALGRPVPEPAAHAA
jgi:antitoxin HicB